MDISIGLALILYRFHVILLAQLSLSRPSSLRWIFWFIRPFEHAKYPRTLDHQSPRRMGTNGTPLVSYGFCSIDYMQGLSVNRALRYWTQSPRTSVRECQSQQYRPVAHFPNLYINNPLAPPHAPSPNISTNTFSYRSTYTHGYHGFAAASIAEGDCEMQRLEEACFDMAKILQPYWCNSQPVATLALCGPRNDPRMA